MALIYQSDKRRFSRLQEELENDYVKGVTTTYPTTVVKAFQMLNDFRHYESTLKKSGPTEGVSFAQNDGKKSEKSIECFKCHKKGSRLRISLYVPRRNQNRMIMVSVARSELLRQTPQNQPTSIHPNSEHANTSCIAPARSTEIFSENRSCWIVSLPVTLFLIRDLWSLFFL